MKTATGSPASDKPSGGGAGLTMSALDDVTRGQTLNEQVYLTLRKGLLTGAWKPGAKITARQISRVLGVSLTPAREAVIRLADEGAIAVSEKRTFSIPLLDAARYREITDIRSMLEPRATELATPRLSRGFVTQLAKLNERMRKKIEGEAFDEALRIDSEFHLRIYDEAGSPVLRRMIDSLWLQVGPTRTRLSVEYRRQLVGYRNHLRIIEALESGDAASAAVAMRDDLERGAAALIADLP